MCDNDRAEHIQHGESRFHYKLLQKRDPAEEPSWARVECNRATGHTGEWVSFRKINGRSSNGQQPEPEEEGETRVRVAFSSKMWLGVKARLNGQRHYLWRQQLRHNKSGRRDGEKVQGWWLFNKDEQTGDHWNGPYEIQDHIENRSTTTMNKYPHVGKTGVDAEHGSCPQMVYIMKEM